MANIEIDLDKTDEELAPEVNANDAMPSPQSMNELHVAFNQAVEKFRDDNPNVKTHILMPSILDVMLIFPWSWLEQLGKKDEFVKAMSHEAATFQQLMLNKEALFSSLIKKDLEDSVKD